MLICMRTTLNINDELLERAQQLTGESGKTRLVHLGLEALVQRTAAQRLAALGGSDPLAESAPRRKRSRLRG